MFDITIEFTSKNTRKLYLKSNANTNKQFCLLLFETLMQNYNKRPSRNTQMFDLIQLLENLK